MDKKRKISVRKVLRLAVTVVATTACLVASLGAARVQRQKPLRKAILHVRNDQYQFLNKQRLWNNLVTRQGITEGVTSFADIDLNRIERRALLNPWICASEAYIDNQGDMHLFVTQRIPVSRIFYDNGTSFYIDKDLNLLPLSDVAPFYTLVVSNVPYFADNERNKDLRAKIVRLIKYVEKDTFWSAQIAQISIVGDQQFELTPVLGTHRILFGDTTDMEVKFNHLFAFYKNVLNRIGWDRYELIDLRFREQIIASPTIPWEADIKNPISNMDWVKTIVGSGIRDTSAMARVIRENKKKAAQKAAKAKEAKTKLPHETKANSARLEDKNY